MTAPLRRFAAAATGLALIAVIAATSVSPAATPTGTSPYTRFVWGDEFNTAAGTQPDKTKWQMKNGTPWNSSLNSYTNRTANVRIDGAGALDLIARKETYKGADGVTRNYTSGAILTRDSYKFTYGHVEARVKVPAGKGFWSAFWTLRYPIGGEIDILEHKATAPTKVHTNIRNLKTDGRQYWSAADWVAPVNLTQAYHVYGMTWEPGRISWQVDGKQVRTVSPANLPADYRFNFTEPEWIIMNLAVGGTWTVAPDSTTTFPSRMKIDWVRVYQ
jgi:beta-glucanase (GH16 family)